MKNLMLSTLTLLFISIMVSCSSNEKTATEQATVNQEQTEDNRMDLTDNSASTIEEEMQEETEVSEETSIEEPTTEKPAKPANENTKKEVPGKEIITENKRPTKSNSQTSKKPTKVETKPLPTKKPTSSPKPSKTSTSSSKPAKTTSKPIQKPVKTSGKPSHTTFNSLLSTYVSSTGSVNYAGFKGKMGDLDKYLKLLAENPVQSNWSRNEKMAYWINLYNAATIRLILDNYPTSSIQNINNGKPWDKKWIKSGSKTYTLNEIENSILRPQFKDARIHFAVNCAAISCPRLMNKAFTASNLNSLLDQNAKWFINNSTFNDISGKSVEISKIFDWYSVDFGNIVDYLNKYSNTTIKSNAKVTYKEYNWKLNGK